LLVGRRSEPNGGQNRTDQQHQQIDFHELSPPLSQLADERNAKDVPFEDMTLGG
jgi:hypothetical protein